MTVYLGQAAHDENGRYVGGAAGNQTGDELNKRAWWNNGWKYVIRFKDAARRKKCGDAAAAGVANLNIGYDQGQRNTLLTQAEKVNYDLSRVSVKCETDCSAFAGVCGIAAGAPKSKIYVGGNLVYTGDIVEKFVSTGLVDVFTSSAYTASALHLCYGDILVSSGHAAIVISGGTGSDSGSTNTTSGGFDVATLNTIRKGSEGAQVRSLQALLNAKNNAGLVVDGDAGALTDKAIRNYQQKKGLAVDGECGKNTWTAILTS